MKNIKRRVTGAVLAASLIVTSGIFQYDAHVQAAQADADFVMQMQAQGFPQSYIEGLSALHAKYPMWEFEAVNTGLDWPTVIEMESRNGYNLVPKSGDDARKSTEAGAYDWYTNTWTIYDGSSWVGAHPDYIAYCMDPRNFLDEKSIFQFEKLSYSETQTIDGVRSIIRGTFMEKSVEDTDGTILDYAEAFVSIGQETGVSPYHLASRVRQEQGTNGTGSLISGRYAGFTGYFNYFNVGATGVTSTLVVQNGLTYAKKAGWNTRYKALLGGAQLLAKNYISVGQDTLYFQKFNVVNRSNLYSHQYMTNVTAAITEGQKLGEGYQDKNQAFVFRIPVYGAMPEAASAFTASGNPNNYLKTLTVTGYTLTPSFDGATDRYSILVESGVDSIEVAAAAAASTSTVSGTGKIPLQTGTNNIEVVCTSGSGSRKIYTLTVVREGTQPDVAPSGEVKVTSGKYQIGSKYVTGLTPGLKASAFLKNVSVQGASLKLVDTSGKENKDKLATGNQLLVYDSSGKQVKKLEIVLYGDVNGDGDINVLDMIKVNRHILGLGKISGCYLKAADANRDGDQKGGGVNVLDMIYINRHALGLTSIRQD